MLQETDEKASARECDGGQIHRPPGQKLNGDPGAVETDHQGEGGRHRGAGHASPGYQAEGGGSDGHLHRGPGAVDPLLCGPGGAGEYPPEAGGGHRGGQSQGGRFGREKKPVPDGFEDLWGRYRRREITARAAAGQLGVVHSTFLKWGRMAESGLPKD